MLRLLISDITVVKGPDLLRLQIRWQGGATETIECVNHQTAQMQFVIPKHSSLKSAPSPNDTLTKRSLFGSMPRA
jgi:hypothetical protein